ncbi:hypothetical protein ACX80E_01755 [Arthrobacter sp. TMN-49]
MDVDDVANSFARLWPPERVVATTGQLLHAGLDTRTIEAGVRLNLLLRLRRGVYVPRQRWQKAMPWDRDKLALAGHIAVSNGSYVYSHFSSARLHKLQLWNSSKLIHVTTPYSSSPSRTSPDIAVHFAKLAPSDVVQRFIPGVGLARHTNLPRTVLECAMRGSLEQAVIIGDSALNAGLELHELQELAESFLGCRGIKRARRAIKALDGGSESAGESRTRLLVRELPIEQPELQAWLDTANGPFRVDFVWRGIRLVLEFDGDTKYFDYKPTAEALIEERERENALIEEGWRFIRVKWQHLSNPELLKARIMNAYLAAQQAAA